MRAVLLVVSLAVCLALASAQLQFSGTFTLRHPLMAGGVVNGEIQYSWPTRSYRLFFSKSSFQEIYVFNTQRGYNASADRPYLNQWVYKSGRTCACETGPVDFAMPQMFVGEAGITSAFTASGSSRTINGRTCAQYTRNAGARGNVMTLFWDEAQRQVCQVVFDDFREMTFTTLSATAPAASSFTPPAGCKCGQPVDIALVLDRSGSISISEWNNQRNFVVGFTSMFSYGPFGANLALVHFNTPAWTTLRMVEGVNDLNVNRSISALGCCTNSTDTTRSCCCCGTAISRGMRLGADELATGRARVEKVMIVITDGYANHDYQGNSCPGGNCDADLRAAVQYIYQRAGADTKIYAVGVGSDRDVSADEMLIIADNHPERVLRYSDFTNLAQNSLDLVARACQENINPCGGCCGFCVCGQCTAPDACDQLSFCGQNNISGVCCKQTPRDCTNPADKCKTYSCNEQQQACLETPITCKPDTNCFKYACEPTTGICNTQSLCSGEPECAQDLDCNDNNACTRDRCAPDFKCTWENITATCDDGNACTDDRCLPSTGCVNEAFNVTARCDDQSVCTTDTCDPAVGCVHTNITCADDNACTDDLCDAFKGCQNVPRICPNNGKDKCTINYCINGTCRQRNEKNCVPVVAAAATLTTAAIIGIVIGVVLCAAGIGGGGAYAYSQAAGTGSAAPVANNPIYVGSGAQGTNPLYKS